MTRISHFGAFAAVTLSTLLLAACSASHVPQMNATEMSGDGFNRHLARNYKEFSNFEAYKMEDWSDAVVYADKSMAAAAGNPSSPDDMSTRNIAGEANVAELRTARGRLMQALSAGAAQKAPADAATAQANFDCWVEQQEEGWQTWDIAACKDRFSRAMQSIDTAMAPAPAPRPTAQVTPVPAQAAAYLVFFDWDKSILTPSANTVLDQAIQRARATGQDIHLIGHADASGADAYNMNISRTRAETVKQHLVAQGIPAASISTRWVGEGEPLVATADGVREAQNRRVEIDLQTLVSSR